LKIDDYLNLSNNQTRQLNEEQILAFRAIERSVIDEVEASKVFFIDGPGGSEKTFLYTALTYFCKANNMGVISVASTSIAATLLLDGRTYHSQFKVPKPTF
jgi:hypothetical protein